MSEVLETVLEALEGRRRVALVTPVAAAGSLPTGREARMLVGEDGRSVGTVGGGRMEAEAQQAARQVAADGKPRLLPFSLTARDALDDGLLCGGETTFFVEPVGPGTPPEPFREMLRMARQRKAGLEAVVLQEEGTVRRRVQPEDGPAVGTLGSAELDRRVSGRVPEAVAEDLWEVMEAEEAGRPVRVFLNALRARPKVMIFGGGHVGLAVARIAPTAGFLVWVMDDRPEFASRGRFPGVDAVRVVDFARAFEQAPVDGLSYVVVMTRGHRWDREVVAQALRTDAAYIGMIGSRRKVNLTFEALRAEGFTEADMARVHAPIGLDLGGDTPGEIAISVVAELVRVRRKGKPERAVRRLHAEKGTPVPWDVILSRCR